MPECCATWAYAGRSLPSFSRARTTRAPGRPAAALGSRRKPDFDRGDDRLRPIRRRLILEIQLQRLAQIGECLVDGPDLTGNLNVEAASHIPVAVRGDGGSQPDCPLR
jgi:hypothetical protein